MNRPTGEDMKARKTFDEYRGWSIWLGERGYRTFAGVFNFGNTMPHNDALRTAVFRTRSEARKALCATHLRRIWKTATVVRVSLVVRRMGQQ